MAGLIVALTLVAQSASPSVAPYRAQGGNPAWSLTVVENSISFDETGRPTIAARARRSESEGMVEYRAGQLTVNTHPSPCDGANGQRYVDTVFVMIGRREYVGCGGAALPANSLDGTSWHFTEIAGEAIPLTGDLLADDSYAIDFGADGFVGYGGCNRFSAAYSRGGETLTAHAPWGSTAGRCAEPVMTRERRLLQILTAPVQVSFPNRDTLVLAGEAGTVRLRRTPHPVH